MFLNFLKNYFLLRVIKNNLENVKSSSEIVKIKSIGLIINESVFENKECLIDELIKKGFDKSNISTIVYRDKWTKAELYTFPTFGLNHLSWNAQIKTPLPIDFCLTDFDLLINYYDTENAFLFKITNDSKAKFKVGFSSIDKRLNHFTIQTDIANYTVFVNELYRYLKILNKI